MKYLKMSSTRSFKILLIFPFILSHQIHGNISKSEFNTKFVQIDTSKIHRIDKFDNILKGSPYFLNSWFSDAIIYLNNSKIVADLAYNIYTNELLFFKGDVLKAVLIKPDSFNLAGYEFIKVNSKIKPKNTNYFQKIYSTEKLQLLKHFSCEFYRKNETTKVGYENWGDPFYGYYLKKVVFYLIKGNSKIEIDNLFTKKIKVNRTKMEDFIIKNNLDLKNEKEVIELITYYNSII